MTNPYRLFNYSYHFLSPLKVFLDENNGKQTEIPSLKLTPFIQDVQRNIAQCIKADGQYYDFLENEISSQTDAHALLIPTMMDFDDAIMADTVLFSNDGGITDFDDVHKVIGHQYESIFGPKLKRMPIETALGSVYIEIVNVIEDAIRIEHETLLDTEGSDFETIFH